MGQKVWCVAALASVLVVLHISYPAKRFDFHRGTPETHGQSRVPLQSSSCSNVELSSGNHSRFLPRREHSAAKVGWFQLGILQSCCAKDRCQKSGGDIFLAFLDGQTSPRALMQPLVHDFGNGYYALLLPEDTLLPSGTYELSIYLHEALNRSAYMAVSGKKVMPLADPQGQQDVLDALDVQRRGSRSTQGDLGAVYLQVESPLVKPIQVDWHWPGNLELWKAAVAQLPVCGPQFSASRRQGGFWLRLGGKHLPCKGFGRKGCGAFGLLLPDSEFHHVYLERRCYYPLRDDRQLQKCLFRDDLKVLLHGDSTTHGLLQEAQGMWSEVKPFKDALNKSESCRYNASGLGEGAPHDRWTSEFCNFRGESLLHDVVLDGRVAVSSPKQYFRKPRCHGLKNLQDEDVFPRFIKMIQEFDVLVMHSCDHDMCNLDFAKPRLLEEYQRNLRKFASVMRKHASGKRIIWLSCAAQSGLTSPFAHFSHIQVVKWRMDRLAFEMCQRNHWEFIDGFSLYSAAMLRPRWFDHLGKVGDLHTHSFCCPKGSLAEIEQLRKSADPLPYRLAFQGGAGYLSRMLVQLVFNQICHPPVKATMTSLDTRKPLTEGHWATTTQPARLTTGSGSTTPSEAENSATEGCDLRQISSAKVSKFVEVGMRREVKAGWLQFGMLRSCCGEDRCQTTGGDVFLAYLDGQQEPKALMQPSVHDFGNGSYALLLPEDTMLPTGTYKLSIYLHQALNRSAYRSLAGKTAPWPLADIFAAQDILDSFDVHKASSNESGDLRAVYVHLRAMGSVPTWDLHWQWPGAPGGQLEAWKSALSQLPLCGPSAASRREGGFWLGLGKDVPCEGVGRLGCGAFRLLSPDSVFHHIYMERDCYYVLRDNRDIQKCLGDDTKVLMLGDSTTHGLLQEALTMWSEVKPFINGLNKSEGCSFQATWVPRKRKKIWLWSSQVCSYRGESLLNDVVLEGRAAVSSPAQFFRTPQCQGLANLADSTLSSRFAKLLQPYDILVLHSCSHDLCNYNYAKPRLLEQYRQNLRRLSKILRKYAPEKRIIWLSCQAQSSLNSTWMLTLTQVFKWRMDRIAFEICKANGWEFIDGFSLYSAALLRERWFDHRGLAGDVHTHSHCCPRGTPHELEALRNQSDPLPYRLALQGGAGYLSRVLVQVIFNQICSPSSSSSSSAVTQQSKPSPERDAAVLPSPKLELPLENHWISEKVTEKICDSNELSSAKVSKFVEVGMRRLSVKAGWLQFGMLRSCCGEDRCQTAGGDVFLAYLDGQQEPKALMQPSVHDFGNGSYALLLPEDTMLPTGTYKLSIYLHQALNRSAYRSFAGKTAAWPVADVFGRQDVLDSFDLQASSADLRAIYVHLKATTSVPTSDVHWQWPGAPGGNLSLWKSALSQLPSCPSSTAFKRQGGFWLELTSEVGVAGVACSGVGKKGCGAFQLLSPDAAFHHLYLERDCYYPMRDAKEIQKCLGKMGVPRAKPAKPAKPATVLLLGDSTTQGLLQEALGMWSQVKPFKNPWNKSDVCSYSESYSSKKKRVVGLWSSKLCDTYGEAELRVVRLGGRGAVAMPRTQHLRTPKCRGLGNLADDSVVHDLIEEIQKFDVLVLHSCDHDLCIEDGISKPRVLQHYQQNLQHLAELLRKHAAGKRILWLSCAAQGNLLSTWKVTQAQVFKWRLDRLAFEACRQNGWEFIDGFTLISAALLKNRWFDHRGIAGNLHTHTQCCPRGSAAELEFLRQQEDQLPYQLAYQGGVGYLSKILMQLIFHQICAV